MLSMEWFCFLSGPNRNAAAPITTASRKSTFRKRIKNDVSTGKESRCTLGKSNHAVTKNKRMPSMLNLAASPALFCNRAIRTKLVVGRIQTKRYAIIQNLNELVVNTKRRRDHKGNVIVLL